jgi:hypothetical protein
VSPTETRAVTTIGFDLPGRNACEHEQFQSRAGERKALLRVPFLRPAYTLLGRFKPWLRDSWDCQPLL